MSEQWKDVVGYEGLYQVSDLGRVYSVRSRKVLKPWKGTWGYVFVSLRLNGKTRKHSVHRLVLSVFVGPGDGLDCCHLNNTKDDNRLVNLKWGTRAENLQQCFVEGRSHKGKLSVAQVKEIRESDLSCTALAAKYGMCKSNMHKIKSGKYWSYVT